MELTLVLANMALVAITAYYAWQTRLTVREMRESRAALVRPAIALDLWFLSTTYANPRVRSVGAGPAYNVRVDLHCSWDDGDRSITWATSVLGSGEWQDFYFPFDGDRLPDMDWLEGHDACVTLSATFDDAFGDHWSANDTVNIGRIVSRLKNAYAKPVSPPEAESLESIAGSLKQLAHKG